MELSAKIIYPADAESMLLLQVKGRGTALTRTTLDGGGVGVGLRLTNQEAIDLRNLLLRFYPQQETTPALSVEAAPSTPKRRGRVKGSKNKPKAVELDVLDDLDV